MSVLRKNCVKVGKAHTESGQYLYAIQREGTDLKLNHVIVTPVNGRFAQNVSLRHPYQVGILLFLCLQINISAKVKS